MFVSFINAVSTGNTGRLMALVNQHPEYVNKMINNQPPMYHACFNGHFESAAILLRHGADPTTFATSMICLVGKSHLINIATLLLQHGAQINEKAVLKAVSGGHTDYVDLFLKYGCSPNLCESDTGKSLLWYAFYWGFPRMSKLLLIAGADPYFKIKVYENGVHSYDTPLNAAYRHRLDFIDYRPDFMRQECIQIMNVSESTLCLHDFTQIPVL